MQVGFELRQADSDKRNGRYRHRRGVFYGGEDPQEQEGSDVSNRTLWNEKAVLLTALSNTVATCGWQALL